MKKLFLLLFLIGVVLTSCENGSDVDENNGTAPSVPQIELAQQIIEVEFEANEYAVTVTSPYSWEATSKDEWIIVESRTGIAGTKELSFKVECNKEEKGREGTIVIKNSDYNLIAELYVIQKSFVPEINIALDTLNFAAEGGTQEVVISSNFEYDVEISADWITLAKTDNGIAVTVSNYTEVEGRTTNITIYSQKYNISKVIKVSQDAFEPEISIEVEMLNFAAGGGTQKVVITSNFEYEVKSDADWFSIERTEYGISVTTPNYMGIDKRTANIAISSEKYGVLEKLIVSQSGVPSISYTSSDGEIVIPLYNNNATALQTFGANILSNTYENGKGVIIFDGEVSSIGNYAFHQCNSLTSITIPDSATSIRIAAFNGCSSLTSVTIGNSVTSIEESAFSGCSSLTSITIPDSVTSIGKNAFRQCRNLTSVTIGNSVTSIGRAAFESCSSLTAFYGKFASADNRCLIVNGVLNSFAIGCGLIEYTIPNSVSSIGEEAFTDCNCLTSITIPDSVTSIEYAAFSYCRSLTSVTIGNSVTSIGRAAFFYCSSLTSITIPDSVTSIGDIAFESCRSLTSVTIGNSVTSIGKNAFLSCYSLTNVYCKPTYPPTTIAEYGVWGAFDGNASDRKIYVPYNSVSVYKATKYWSNYANYLVGYDFE